MRNEDQQASDVCVRTHEVAARVLTAARQWEKLHQGLFHTHGLTDNTFSFFFAWREASRGLMTHVQKQGHVCGAGDALPASVGCGQRRQQRCHAHNRCFHVTQELVRRTQTFFFLFSFLVLSLLQNFFRCLRLLAGVERAHQVLPPLPRLRREMESASPLACS